MLSVTCASAWLPPPISKPVIAVQSLTPMTLLSYLPLLLVALQQRTRHPVLASQSLVTQPVYSSCPFLPPHAPPPPMPGRAACPDTVSKAQGRKPLASINTLFSAAGLLKVWNHIPDPPLPPFQPTIPGLSLGAGAGEQSVEPLSRLLMPSPTFSAGLAGSRPFRRHFSPVGLVLGLPSLIPETVTGSAPVTCCAMSMCTSASPAGGKLLKERTVYLRPSSPHPISPTWQGSVVENKGFRIRSVWVQRGDLATCYMSDLRQVFRPL